MKGLGLGFLRINLLSALYALPFVIFFEIEFNFYRIERLTSWGSVTMNQIMYTLPLILWLAATAVAYVWSRKYLRKNWIRYLSALLWLPYAALLLYGFGRFFPLTHPGDSPAPVLGLLLFGAAFVYPIYVLILNALVDVNWLELKS